MREAITVAVVDDEASMREATRSLLSSAGFATCIFATAEDFLASAAAATPDCIVLDVALPGMSGLQLHRYLVSCGTHIPVVFITGHDLDGRAQLQALRDGASALLHKPFRDAELLHAIDRAIAADADRCG